MSLDYNLTRIKNYETVCTHGDRMNPVTEGLIWSTICVDLGEITEKNVDEWETRFAILKKVGESPMPDIKRHHITTHIGLRTNVCSMTRARWLSKLIKGIAQECERNVRREGSEASQ